MKKTVFVWMSLMLVFALSGCGSEHKVRKEAAGETPVTLRLSWWGNDLRNETTIQVIKMYEKQNPHVRIEYEYSAFNEYWRKMAPYAAGNALPDIIQMDISYLSQYASLGLLEDMLPYTLDGTIDTDRIGPSHLDGGMIDGSMYGLSLGANALFGAYDPEVFKESGIEPPTPSWTWSDFDEMGEKLKGTGKRLATQFTPEQFFAYYLRQYGQTLFAPDGSKLGYEDDALFVEYFGRMQRLVLDKMMYSPDEWTHDANMSDSMPFDRGEALLTWGYSNQFVAISHGYGKPLEIAPMPGPNNDRGLFVKPGMFFSIAQNSKHKEEAAKFISFFVNDLEANKILMGERGVPISSEVKEGLKPYLSPEQAKVFEYMDWVEDNSSPMDPPDPAGTPEVTAVLRDLNDQLLFGRITPEAAAIQFRAKANDILARSREP